MSATKLKVAVVNNVRAEQEGTTGRQDSNTHATSATEVERTHGTTGRRRSQRGRYIRESPRSMGRYPFLSRVDDYLRQGRRTNNLTFAERRRKLIMLAGVYNRLLNEQEGLRADPIKFGEREVFAIVDWMRSKGFTVGYQVKLVQYLQILLRHIGNPILDRMRSSRADLPKPARKRLSAPSDAVVKDTLLRLETVESWKGDAIRFAVAFHYATGVRVKELRLSALHDLDLIEMRFTIRHPKGEGVYADEGRRIRIPPSLLPTIQDFLNARSIHCAQMGADPMKVEPLIPAWDGRYYSESGWRSLRVKVFGKVGVRGNFRELRPAHAQQLKKGGVAIEAVSKRLGHSSTKTTEAFYARIEDEEAEDQCIQAWESAQVVRPASD